MALIEVKNVVFEYPDGGADSKIIKDISFKAEPGEFVSIIGPSGCGKSTMLRIIAGLIEATSGEVLYMNRKITKPIPEISFVFQDFALLPWLTNIQNVVVGLSRERESDNAKAKRADELLKEFGLGQDERAYPNTISGGMKQRVAIARALASSPKVLLMDEPFSALDEMTAEELRSDIISMHRSKKLPVSAIIMVTHNVEEAVELSDKVVVLSDKPSVVKATKEVSLKYPRDKRSRGFFAMMDEIRAALAK